jgi:glycosyltransferase involved in cell wall biosynthesis
VNILHVYYEPQPSGQTAHVLSLVRGLDRRQYRQVVVLPDSLQASVAALEQAGVLVRPLPLRKLLWPPAALVALTRLIRRENFDIVHVHSQEAGLVARWVARMAGARRILYTPQTIDIRLSRWHWLYILVERGLAQLTDRIVSVCAADRARLIRWGIAPRKVVVIPNGIDLSLFNIPADPAGLRRQLGVSETRPLVMQVGRLSPQKNPLAFVDGAARVRQTCPDAQFVLVGEGPLQAAVAGRVRTLGLAGDVCLAGWREAAFRFMAAAHVVTLTSRWEGAPYSLLEAMASARPVVATSVNGCPEMVEDGVTGFLLPSNDVAAWAKRVVELLRSPVAGAMGQRGRQRVEERFSTQRMVAEIEALYQRVVEEG